MYSWNLVNLIMGQRVTGLLTHDPWPTDPLSALLWAATLEPK